MLDTFLEVLCQKTKTAQAADRRVELLQRLPMDVLHKLASGEEKLAFMCSSIGEGDSWLKQFEGSPLLPKAIELAKASLQHEIQRNAEMRQSQAASQEQYNAEDDLRVQKKMLELELVSAAAGIAEPAAVEPELEAVEEVAGEEPVAPPVEEEVPPAAEAAPPPQAVQPQPQQPAQPPQPEKPKDEGVSVEVKKQASVQDILAMRMKLAMMKQAFNPMPEIKAVGSAVKGFATGAAKNIGSAYQSGGLRAAGSMAKDVGKSGLQMAGGYAKANPLAAAGMAGAAGLGAGYVGSKITK